VSGTGSDLYRPVQVRSYLRPEAVSFLRPVAVYPVLPFPATAMATVTVTATEQVSSVP